MVLQSFIVFEGLDGSGTSTQIKLLQEKISEQKAWFTAEPTNNETGLFLRKMLKGEIKIHPKTSAYMFATDRCEHINGKNGIQENLIKAMKQDKKNDSNGITFVLQREMNLTLIETVAEKDILAVL